MYQIFNFEKDNSVSRLNFGRFNNLQRNIKVALHLLTQAQRRGVKVVKNDHVLVQLIKHLRVSQGRDEWVYEFVGDYAKNYTTALDINSNRNKIGAARNNSFFPITIKEFYLYKETSFKRPTIHWSQWEPVAFISHPFTSWNFNLRNTLKVDEFFGEAFIEIDIPLLLLQYKYWAEWYTVMTDGLSPYPSQFVYQFVLPNLLKSDLDVVFLNRLGSRFLDYDVKETKALHGIALNTSRDLLDDYIDFLESNLILKDLSYLDTSKLIVLPSGKTLHEKLYTKDLFIGSQLTGVYNLATYPYLALLKGIQDITLNRDNRTITNYMTRRLRLLGSGGFFRQLYGVDAGAAQNKLALTIPQT